MKIFLNEGNQIHNFISSSGSGTVINYGSSSGSVFLTNYGSGSTSQKVTVPTVPVPVPQHCRYYRLHVTSIFFLAAMSLRATPTSQTWGSSCTPWSRGCHGRSVHRLSHRVFAYSAGGPGLDSRLRCICLGCSMQRM